jgi:nicotinamidase-related amidase
MNQTPTIDPKHTALLVMDYQNAMVNQMANQELLAKMAPTIQFARDNGIHVGYVWVAFNEDDYQAIPETNKVFASIGDQKMLHHEAPESQIHAELEPQTGDIVVRKIRFGAFSTTDLDEQLKAKDIDTLILTGISTSGVVLSTTREAADRDYRIYVLKDLTADHNDEVHKTLTEHVLPMQAYVISTAELPELLQKA